MEQLSRLTQGVFAATLLFFSGAVLMAKDLFPRPPGEAAGLANEWMVTAALACALPILALALHGPLQMRPQAKPYLTPFVVTVHGVGWGLFLLAELAQASALGTL